MKRASVNLIIVLILLLLTSCNSSKDIMTVRNGTYVLEQTGREAGIYPQVTVSNDSISFSYDPLSSYLPVGVYTIEENILTMMTEDRLYKYVFRMDGDKLIFQKNESSTLKLTNDRIGINIINNAEFKLKEN